MPFTRNSGNWTMPGPAAPPTFAIVTNRPDDVPESYQRYLAHGFRAAWGFAGSPLRLKFTRRGSAGKKR